MPLRRAKVYRGAADALSGPATSPRAIDIDAALAEWARTGNGLAVAGMLGLGDHVRRLRRGDQHRAAPARAQADAERAARARCWRTRIESHVRRLRDVRRRGPARRLQPRYKRFLRGHRAPSSCRATSSTTSCARVRSAASIRRPARHRSLRPGDPGLAPGQPAADGAAAARRALGAGHRAAARLTAAPSASAPTSPRSSAPWRSWPPRATPPRRRARRRSRFLARMSHELRTPLNGVLGFAQALLQDPRLNPSSPSRSRRSTSRAGTCWTWSTACSTSPRSRPAGSSCSRCRPPCRVLLESCVTLVNPAARHRDVDVALRDDAALPRHVMVDETRLRQVLLNLLSNAIKFSPERGRVELRCFRSGDPDAEGQSRSASRCGTKAPACRRTSARRSSATSCRSSAPARRTAPASDSPSPPTWWTAWTAGSAAPTTPSRAPAAAPCSGPSCRCRRRVPRSPRRRPPRLPRARCARCASSLRTTCRRT